MRNAPPFAWPARPLLLLTTLLTTAVQAQTSRPAVSGQVLTPAGTPVEFATLTLHRAADSVLVKSEFSDDKGAFRLEAAAGGRYLVSAAQVGYRRYWSAPLELSGGELKLAPIQLAASGATALKEVTVTARKPLYERLADRTVVNVEGSALAAGNTTLDVLSRAPGVTVDGSDNLALRGRQGLLVLIDGKRQPMSGSELADYLRALPADQLKSIELITNPPAKYDAQGGAGIIAINLKKDQRLGTNGSFNLSGGRGQYNKLNTGLTLNHRRKNVSLFGSYSLANRQGFAALTIHRDFLADGQRVGSSDQDNRVLIDLLSHNYKLGADYTLSKRSTLGAVVNGQFVHLMQDGNNQSQVFDAQQQPASRYQSENTRNDRSPNAAANLNFRHVFADSAGAPTLSADADYARYTTTRRQSLLTRYELPVRPEVLLNGNQNGALSIQSVKADYTGPLPHRLRLEAGAKSSLVKSDNDVVFVNTVENVSTIDLNQTNRFRYSENINAGYFTLSRDWPGLSLSAGLRGEQTVAHGQQDVGNEGFDRNYFQLFPSAGIKRTLSKDHELALSLSRRIDRPTYNQLNPFRSYIDATTFGAGNPDLLPQTSYNLELTHTFRQKYSTGLSYARTSNPIIGAVQPLDATSRTVVSRDVNLDAQHYLALTLTAPLELAKWWNVYNNVVLYYSYFEGSLAGTGLSRGRPAFNLSSNSTFAFGQGWSAELSGLYQSREQYGFLDVRPQGQLTAGLQKAVWNRKGNLKLSVSDIFYTQKVRATSSYDNYVEQFYQRQDSRVATLAFSYRFGNEKLPPARRRQGGAEDEKRRAG